MNKIYWIIVEVLFDEPISSPDENILDTVGFFQTFGCTTRKEEIMKEHIYSSLFKTEWLENLRPEIKFDIYIIENENVENEILLDNEINEYISSSPYENGLWYESGRAYFHEIDDTDDSGGYLINVVPKDMH